ncbi:hypothetical protein Tco_1265663 [Tanacetum coccineum]
MCLSTTESKNQRTIGTTCIHSKEVDGILVFVDPQDLLGSFLLAGIGCNTLVLLTDSAFLFFLGFLEYTNLTTGLGDSESRTIGFLGRHFISSGNDQVKGHALSYYSECPDNLARDSQQLQRIRNTQLIRRHGIITSHKASRSERLYSSIVGDDCLRGLKSSEVPGFCQNCYVLPSLNRFGAIPFMGLMVVENKRCGERWIDTHLLDKRNMVKRDVEIETVGEWVDEIDKLAELIIGEHEVDHPHW